MAPPPTHWTASGPLLGLQLRLSVLRCCVASLTSLFQLVVARKFAVGEKSMADTVSLGELGTIRSLLACVTAACMAMAPAAERGESGGGQQVVAAEAAAVVAVAVRAASVCV